MNIKAKWSNVSVRRRSSVAVLQLPSYCLVSSLSFFLFAASDSNVVFCSFPVINVVYNLWTEGNLIWTCRCPTKKANNAHNIVRDMSRQEENISKIWFQFSLIPYLLVEQINVPGWQKALRTSSWPEVICLLVLCQVEFDKTRCIRWIRGYVFINVSIHAWAFIRD